MESSEVVKIRVENIYPHPDKTEECVLVGGINS